MKVVCGDRRQKSQAAAPEDRAMSSVAADINRLLAPKSYPELETLEAQIRRKLDSKDPIDTDYWEQLLRSLTVWKARAKLKKVYQAVIDGRVQWLRKQQREEAEAVRNKLAPLAPIVMPGALRGNSWPQLDPEPLLQLLSQDKSLEVQEEEVFLARVVCKPCLLQLNYSSNIPTGFRSSKNTEDGLCAFETARYRETLGYGNHTRARGTLQCALAIRCDSKRRLFTSN